jgi:hypothetical protein
MTCFLSMEGVLPQRFHKGWKDDGAGVDSMASHGIAGPKRPPHD